MRMPVRRNTSVKCLEHFLQAVLAGWGLFKAPSGPTAETRMLQRTAATKHEHSKHTVPQGLCQSHADGLVAPEWCSCQLARQQTAAACSSMYSRTSSAVHHIGQCASVDCVGFR